jgi:hypothetical protein
MVTPGTQPLNPPGGTLREPRIAPGTGANPRRATVSLQPAASIPAGQVQWQGGARVCLPTVTGGSGCLAGRTQDYWNLVRVGDRCRRKPFRSGILRTPVRSVSAPRLK